MLTEDDRATPQGFFNFAEDYLEAGYVLRKHMRAGNHRGEVLKFTLFHAVEMYLKAYLRHRGVSITMLRSKKFGHSYKRLIPACEAQGLNVPAHIKANLYVAESLSDPLEARFFRSAARPRIDPNGLYNLALEVRGLVASHFVCLSRPFDFQPQGQLS